MSPARVLTVDQAAKQAFCHPETIKRAIRKKELLATKHPTKRGRGYEIAVHDFAAWLAKRRLG